MTCNCNAETVYDAIISTDNYSGCSPDELAAGWGNRSVRHAAFTFASDTGSLDYLYQHPIYGEDGLPAIGYQAIAEEIAAEAAHMLEDYSHYEEDAILEHLGIGNTDSDISALFQFIREPYDNGPGFGNSLETITEWMEQTRQQINRALPETWGMPHHADTEEERERLQAYDDAVNLRDDVQYVGAWIHAEARKHADN